MIAASLLVIAAASSPAMRVDERTLPDGAREQVFTVEVAAPAEDMWAAFTTPEGWRKWAVPVAWRRSTSPLIIETSYDAAAKPDGPQTIKQQFELTEPLKRLSFRTIKAPANFPGFETYSRVVSEVTFEPLGAGRTRVRFATGPFPDTDEGRRLYAGFLEGNRSTLERMAKVLARD